MTKNQTKLSLSKKIKLLREYRSLQQAQGGESGRSMLELIMVLGVMGVITVGAMAGYHAIVRKTKTRELMNDASRRAIVIATKALSGKARVSVVGQPRESVLGAIFINNGWIDVSGDTFVVQMMKVPEDICDQIKKTQSEYPLLHSVEGECDPNQVLSFRFDKKLRLTAQDSATSAELCKNVSCSGHSKCENGTCVCTDNYYGDNCQNAPLDCQNGGRWSSAARKCMCVNNYYGSSCESAPLDCGEHGKWNTGAHKCDCVGGYEGETCDTLNPCYRVNCGGHGTCDDGACICSDDYYGERCEFAPLNCGAHGTWDTADHKCDCEGGYSGTNCQTYDTCYGISCGSHGTCENGSCVCTDNYYGANCQTAPLNCGAHGTWNANTHTCDCSDNYYGNTCQTAPLNCQNGGTWNATAHKCDCPEGFSGTTCEVQESCTSNSQCANGQFCNVDGTRGVCQGIAEEGYNIGDGYAISDPEFEKLQTAQNWCDALGDEAGGNWELAYPEDMCEPESTSYQGGFHSGAIISVHSGFLQRVNELFGVRSAIAAASPGADDIIPSSNDEECTPAAWAEELDGRTFWARGGKECAVSTEMGKVVCSGNTVPSAMPAVCQRKGHQTCQNGGTWSPRDKACVCPDEYTGTYCQNAAVQRCTSNSQCTSGKYCNMDTLVSGKGECKPIGSVLNKSPFVASSTTMKRTSAENWCAAQSGNWSIIGDGNVCTTTSSSGSSGHSGGSANTNSIGGYQMANILNGLYGVRTAFAVPAHNGGANDDDDDTPTTGSGSGTSGSTGTCYLKYASLANMTFWTKNGAYTAGSSTANTASLTYATAVCQNNATICQNGGSYNSSTGKCNCPSGYTGDYCETVDNSCTSNSNCTSGYYCNMDTLTNGKGVCTALGSYTTKGVFTVSSSSMKFQSAANWCAAKSMNMYDDDTVCPSNTRLSWNTDNGAGRSIDVFGELLGVRQAFASPDDDSGSSTVTSCYARYTVLNNVTFWGNEGNVYSISSNYARKVSTTTAKAVCHKCNNHGTWNSGSNYCSCTGNYYGTYCENLSSGGFGSPEGK